MKKIHILGYILCILSAVFIGWTVVYLGYFGSNGNLGMLIDAIIIICGGVVMMFLHLLSHELGHLIGGIVGGFSFVSFRIGFIDIEKRKGKTKLSIKKLESYGGMCQMLPPKECKIKDFEGYIKGGLLGSMIFTIISLLLLFIPFIAPWNKYVYLLTAASFPISAYLLFNNMSVGNAQNAMTDGAYLYAIKNNTDEGAALVAIMNYQSLLSGGIRPKDVNESVIDAFPILIDSDPQSAVIASNLFAYYLDKEDGYMTLRYGKKIEDCMPYTANVYYTELKKDVLLGNLLYGDREKAINVYKEIEKDLESESSVDGNIIIALFEIEVNKNHKKCKEYLDKAKKELNHVDMAGLIPTYHDLIEKIEGKALEEKEEEKKEKE